MKEKLRNPLPCIDLDAVKKAGIELEDFKRFIPSYIYNPPGELECNSIKYYALHILQYIIINVAKVVLQPRKSEVGNLDIHEVMEVYDREARTYDIKHHITTRGMDTIWRRWAAQCAVNFARHNNNNLRILDLCTGTGLTVHEMITVFRHWNVNAHVTGLDYNEEMLTVARRREISEDHIEVDFVKGDAMNMVNGNSHHHEGVTRFEEESFDVVTQMFGIGGIINPIAVFQNVIQLLRPGGVFFLTDMHQPIAELPGEWPLIIKWFKSPLLENMAYNNYTIPVVLNRLWGWRDTTLDFYLLPLITSMDNHNRYWGFTIRSFESESMRWWLGLPFMPTAKLIVEKKEISAKEAEKRESILSFMLTCMHGDESHKNIQRSSFKRQMKSGTEPGSKSAKQKVKPIVT